MVTGFDSREVGTSEHVWAAAWPAHLPMLAAPRPGDRLLVIVAHPDDETLGAGGLIATAAEVGASVTVVIASDGEASHPNSATHSQEQLAEIRRAEVTTAVARLHPRVSVGFLGLPDSDLAEHLNELTDHVNRYAAGASLLVTPWSGDRHPDHAACAEVGARVARANRIEHWQFPIWAWHWGTPESPEFLPRTQLRRLLLEKDAVVAKLHAITAHRSQHSALSPEPGDEAMLSESMLAHFYRRYEVFVIADVAPASTAAYFDDLYEHDRDPWKLADRFYERRKRDLLLASLPRERFKRAFEPGCAIGALTAELVERCDEVVAWDGAHIAVDQATARIGGQRRAGRVSVDCARIPADWPSGRFDLIVLSEVGYYCPDLQQLKERVDHSLTADGVLIACHWRHRAPDHPATAEAVHTALEHGLCNIVVHREEDFLLEVWTRDGTSVAGAEGIV
jgi:LmbE family N-acetylglucosaminyl deacetylase/SAM-dependent methyltransferase